MKYNKKKINSLLVRLLLNRPDRLEGFDSTHLHDFHHIMREDYGVFTTGQNINSTVGALLEELHITQDVPFTEVTSILVEKCKIPDVLYRPKMCSDALKKRAKYTQVDIWKDVENATTSTQTVDRLNELQVQYSLQSGGNNEKHHVQWGEKTTATLKDETLAKLRKDGVLSSESDVLCLGPRWVAEINFFRNNLGFPKTIGLDLFSNNPDLIKVGDMHDMPLPDNSFDMVYQRNTFNKSYDLRKCLDECVRILRPGGVIMTDDNVDYFEGVTEIARANPTSLNWFTKYLGAHVQEVVVSKEYEPAPNGYTRAIGLYTVRVK